MADQGKATSCTTMSWALAALGGAVIGVVLSVAVGWTFAPAAVLAVVLAVIVGLFLTLFVCPGRKGPAGHRAPTTSTSTPATAASTMAASSMAVPTAAPAEKAPTEDTQAPVSDPLVAPKDDAPTAETMQEGTVTPPVEDTPAQEPVAAQTANEVTSAPEPAVDPAPQNNAAGPELIDAPRGGTADDLKKIGGVGPKLEQTLNEVGIWHYSQIASWDSNDIAWVDAQLPFKGRIERDDWVGQAEALEQARN